MPIEHVLVVEDDLHISKLLKYNLQKAGYKCSVVITGEEALETLNNEEIDLIILDIMLPKMDGFDTCRTIKADALLSTIPIIILTARGEEVDRVVGLELGADDYVVKPFSVRELILRIKNVLKRNPVDHSEKKAVLELDDMVIDIPRHRVLVKGNIVVLTSMEFNLLVYLMRTRGRVQSREKLLSEVWEMNTEVTTRTVDTHIKCLRQKLGSAGHLIETIRGVGYCLRDDT